MSAPSFIPDKGECIVGRREWAKVQPVTKAFPIDHRAKFLVSYQERWDNPEPLFMRLGSLRGCRWVLSLPDMVPPAAVGDPKVVIVAWPLAS